MLTLKNIFYKFVILSACCFLCVACHRNKPKKISTKHTIITIRSVRSGKVLYYSGVIKPYKKTPVTSPINGVIEKLSFKYGDYVKKGQKLFTIRSQQQQTDYQAALAAYLQQKQSGDAALKKYQDNQKLFDKGLISKNDFETSKSAYYLAELTLLQSKAKLNKLLEFHKVPNVSQLTLKDIEKVSKALQLNKRYQDVNITAPVEGISLFVAKSGQLGKKLEAGDSVKANDVLLLLTPKKGIAVEIQIDEINVNQLHVGQPVMLTSVAVPSLRLKGYVDDIAAQAVSSGGLPTFSAEVVVPKLNKKDFQRIKVGMSVKVMISVKKAAHILIPIKAIHYKKGKSTVTVINPRTKRTQEVPVETGETTFKDVTILSGVKPGDNIVVPN